MITRFLYIIVTAFLLYLNVHFLLFHNNYNAITLININNFLILNTKVARWIIDLRRIHFPKKIDSKQSLATSGHYVNAFLAVMQRRYRQSRKQSGNFLQHRDGLVRITRQTWPVGKVLRFLWVFIARRVGSPSIPLLDRDSTKSTRETTTTPRSKVRMRNLREELRDSPSR